MTRSALLISTAVGLTLGASQPGFALKAAAGHPHLTGAFLKKVHNAQHLPNAPGKPTRNTGPRHSSGLKLASTYLFASDTTTTLFGGFALTSETSIPCKTACTIEVQGLLQFSAYYSYNQFGVCPLVDGYFTYNSCIFENLPSGSGFTPVPVLASQAVNSGSHLAAVYVYTFAPAYLGPMQMDYHVYK
ncbi:MAG: hypothetical protein JO261_13310 [Alphaproteobacteria bacterium]|nr:hypothetical protein [Alphaproteobacteria bacterium]MBV9694670.1 hypothetical protein [Alphaproteobacteria bacterium]